MIKLNIVWNEGLGHNLPFLGFLLGQTYHIIQKTLGLHFYRNYNKRKDLSQISHSKQKTL